MMKLHNSGAERLALWKTLWFRSFHSVQATKMTSESKDFRNAFPISFLVEATKE
jgi:hypothetical protein